MKRKKVRGKREKPEGAQGRDRERDREERRERGESEKPGNIPATLSKVKLKRWGVVI